MKRGDGALEVDVVLPEGVVGVEEQGLARGEGGQDVCDHALIIGAGMWVRGEPWPCSKDVTFRVAKCRRSADEEEDSGEGRERT